MSKSKKIKVTSYNQQGGITAYQVNIQPGDRQLNQSASERLEGMLNDLEFTEVEVIAVAGDGEAFRFASQIKNFLEAKEYLVRGVNQALYTPPIRGLEIRVPEGGTVKVIAGNR